MPWFLRMLLTIFPFILVLQIYVFNGLRLSLNQINTGMRKKTGMMIFSVLGFFNLLPVVVGLAAIAGQIPALFFFRPDLTLWDYLILFPYWWGLILTLEALPYFLVIDLSNFLFKINFFRRFDRVTRIFPYLRIGLVIFLAVYVGFRLNGDSNHIRISRQEIPVSIDNSRLEGLQITLLGDIQVDRYSRGEKMAQLAEKIRSVESDLVLFSGDLVTEGSRYIPEGVELMCGINSRYGKYACLGDHDFWANPQAISGGLQECGWNFIENAHHLITINGHQILVTGITQIYSRKIAPLELDQILSAAPQADLKLLLVHQPSPLLIESAEKHGYHILMAGHTHGGQVQFRPFGWTFTLSMFETPYYSGAYRYKDLRVIVTNGVGFTFAPVRYHAAAEITVIKLISGSKDGKSATVR